MPETVLVTGGLGFIGSNLVDLLVTKGYDVVVIDNLSSGTRNNTNPNATYYYDDVQTFLSNKMNEEIKVIFHLAAEARIQPSFKNPLLWFKSNVEATAVVCDYAKNNNCKVIYAGSSSCYGGKYMNPYTFTKKQAEEICKMYTDVFNVSTVIARFFNVYGPRNPLIGEFTPIIAKFEEKIKNNQPLTIVGDGEQRRDFTHVYDICEGLIQLSQQSWKAEIFNLGTGINYSINELVDMFGGKRKYLPLRPGEAKETKADITKTTLRTGWTPKHKLENYIKEKLNEIKQSSNRSSNDGTTEVINGAK
jgi:UDP-glucose 4-epimerase